MADAPGAAILTIPLSIVYEPAFNVLKERYNNADNAVLPAIRLYEFHDGKRARYEEGFEILQRIVKARVTPIGGDVVPDGAIERAIEASGGNIRELVGDDGADLLVADREEATDVVAVVTDDLVA